MLYYEKDYFIFEYNINAVGVQYGRNSGKFREF